MGERESLNAHGAGESDERSRRTVTLSFPFYDINASTVLDNTLDYGPGLFCLIFCISSTIPSIGMFCRTYGSRAYSQHIVNHRYSG